MRNLLDIENTAQQLLKTKNRLCKIRTVKENTKKKEKEKEEKSKTPETQD